MDQLLLDKEELLRVLHENRDKHREVFEHALAGYKAALLRDLHAKITALEKGRIPDLHIRLAEPTDHTRDYDRVIRMVQMHQGEHYPMDQDDFAQYVQDDWHWKRQWVGTANVYAAASVAQAYGAQDDA